MMHPLIEDIINTIEPINELLLKYSFENNPLIMVIHSLLNTTTRQEREVALNQAAGLNLIGVDPELAILFLYIWGYFSAIEGRKEEFKFIKKIGFSLISKKTPDLLRHYLNSLEIDKSQFHSYEDFILSKEKAISLDGSLGQKRRLNTELKEIAKNGFLSAISKEGKSILEGDEIAFKTYQFINAIEVCDIAYANLLLPFIADNARENKYLTFREFVEYNLILQLLIKKENLDEKIIEKSECDMYMKKQILANLYLFRGQVEKAGQELNGKWTHLVSSNFIYATTFRIFLMEKNIKDTLERLSKHYEVTSRYTLDIYWARLEWLKGDQEKAIKHFAKAMHSAEKYGAKHRLNMELNLAKELSPSDLMHLSIEAAKIPIVEIQSFQLFKPQKKLPDQKGIYKIVGNSNSMLRLKDTIKKYAKLEIPVLIIGETGVGKEVTAQALFEESNRKKEPFLTINCGAIADTLLHSELFGHVAGSFTGATKKHDGLFVSASKGTLFLDEFGETSTKLQVALLRVLETGTVQPVGSTATIPINCRVIFGTNASLEDMVNAGTLRKDLYFRIKRLTIEIPPLRNHIEDVFSLAEYFLKPFISNGKNPLFSDELKEAMLSYSWPGNIREIKNEIERIQFLNSEKEIYTLEDSEMLYQFIHPKKEKVTLVEETKPEAHENPVQPEKEKPKNMRSFSKLPAWRRQNAIIEELINHQRLTRAEIASMFEVSRETASADLRVLVNENRIKMVAPTASSRTNYFVANLK